MSVAEYAAFYAIIGGLALLIVGTAAIVIGGGLHGIRQAAGWIGPRLPRLRRSARVQVVTMRIRYLAEGLELWGNWDAIVWPWPEGRADREPNAHAQAQVVELTDAEVGAGVVAPQGPPGSSCAPRNASTDLGADRQAVAA